MNDKNDDARGLTWLAILIIVILFPLTACYVHPLWSLLVLVAGLGILIYQMAKGDLKLLG